MIDRETVDVNGKKYHVLEFCLLHAKEVNGKPFMSDEEYSAIFFRALKNNLLEDRCISKSVNGFDPSISSYKLLVLAPLDGGVDTIP